MPSKKYFDVARINHQTHFINLKKIHKQLAFINNFCKFLLEKRKYFIHAQQKLNVRHCLIYQFTSGAL